ncbi:MAG: hypothetical protein CME59_02175 [Halioglobus sp.]|nr:hypothetical protein [Halioglobus sp.]|tara:strand:- start:963 stop:1199 length:237 start_codon:yes stop_codon:yes gene_type:complete
MAYTQQDLESVQQALLDAVQGNRVLQVRSANGKTLVYQGASPEQIERMKLLIEADLQKQAAAGRRRSRTRHIFTSKGL